ncbi:fructose-6-phosphate aldolase [Aerococcaceae bacterium DSM 109653]|uniref:Fructose-6-phosphate aldolase n=1 Tax=Fundicoccus ignavus TaxID=2664442 RepID=A0A844C555_9LACT|nr:fructose-6-phosphate aldolase [Fundicoccus ignavus]MRI82621.1 fructose-6-phosphate aldolase [Fundicoccus ignavus]
MEILLDTINLDSIRQYADILPLSGITSNPSIVKREGEINFFEHMKKIKEIARVPIHVQVSGSTKKEILRDAETIVAQLGKETYIKVPINPAGLAAIKELKASGYLITATAIYTEFQGYLAIEAGVDYLAPYYNRMENLNVDSFTVLENLAKEIKRTSSNSKILGASFKNVSQVEKACRAGAQAITIGIDVLEAAFANQTINCAIEAFNKDWSENFGVKTIAEYVKGNN